MGFKISMKAFAEYDL